MASQLQLCCNPSSSCVLSSSNCMQFYTDKGRAGSEPVPIDASLLVSISTPLPIDTRGRSRSGFAGRYRCDLERSRTLDRYLWFGRARIISRSWTRPSRKGAGSAARAALARGLKPPCFAVLRPERREGGPVPSCSDFLRQKRARTCLATRVSSRGPGRRALEGACWTHEADRGTNGSKRLDRDARRTR